MLNFLPITYAFEQSSKTLPIMLNVIPMTTAIMPRFVHIILMIRLAYEVRLQINFNLLFPDSMLLFLIYHAQYYVHNKTCESET